MKRFHTSLRLAIILPGIIMLMYSCNKDSKPKNHLYAKKHWHHKLVSFKYLYNYVGLYSTTQTDSVVYNDTTFNIDRFDDTHLYFDNNYYTAYTSFLQDTIGYKCLYGGTTAPITTFWLIYDIIGDQVFVTEYGAHKTTGNLPDNIIQVNDYGDFWQSFF